MILLLLWKANLDVQFVSEKSLALAHYVTGYITKAEKVICMKFGMKLEARNHSVASYGALVCAHRIAKNVVYTRLLTFYWVTICIKSHKQFNGSVQINHTKEKTRLRNHGKLKNCLRTIQILSIYLIAILLMIFILHDPMN